MAKVKKSRGFTLLELVIVIALLGGLATWVITLINPVAQFRKGRDAQRKSAGKQLQTALELYRADVGQYPDTIPACGGNAFSNGVIIYMQKIPCDPTNTGQLVYTYVGGVTSYIIVVCLENVNDSQKDTATHALCNNTVSYTLGPP